MCSSHTPTGTKNPAPRLWVSSQPLLGYSRRPGIGLVRIRQINSPYHTNVSKSIPSSSVDTHISLAGKVALATFLCATSVQFQVVPPYLHCTNAAERAIQTYKDHLIAGLSSCESNFPLHIWYHLIPHPTLTINLLRPSRLNPRMLAEAQLNGAFDLIHTPLAPPGMLVIVHETPNNRRTWGPQGVDGWYLGPAPEHYQCHRVNIPRTCAECIAKKVEFLPHNCPVPAGGSTSAVTTAARALAEALLRPTLTPFATLGENQFAAIQTLSRIFSKFTEIPPTALTPKTS